MWPVPATINPMAGETVTWTFFITESAEVYPAVVNSGGTVSGQYVLSDVVTLSFAEPGVYVLAVTLTGYTQDGTGVNHTVSREVVITVEDFNVLNGYVTDTATGQPVPGAGVFLFGSSGTGQGVTVPCVMPDGTTYECTVPGADYGTATDTAGWYEFSGIPEDTYEVLVIRDNYEYSRTPGVAVK